MPRKGYGIRVRGGAEADWFWNERIPKAAPAAEGGDNPPGYLCWGTIGTLPTPETVVDDSFQTVDCQETHLEQSRESQVVKIENPENAQDWVEVDRANKMVFKKTENTKTPGSNTSTEPDVDGGFVFEPIVWESFRPLETTSSKKCKLTVTLNNKQRDA